MRQLKRKRDEHALEDSKRPKKLAGLKQKAALAEEGRKKAETALEVLEKKGGNHDKQEKEKTGKKKEKEKEKEEEKEKEK